MPDLMVKMKGVLEFFEAAKTQKYKITYLRQALGDITTVNGHQDTATIDAISD